MNLQRLQAAAHALEVELAKVATTDPQAAGLLTALAPLLRSAQDGTMTVPLAWGEVPGAWAFSEGGLSQHVALSPAYAEFKVEATGGDNPVLAMIEAMKAGRTP